MFNEGMFVFEGVIFGGVVEFVVEVFVNFVVGVVFDE